MLSTRRLVALCVAGLAGIGALAEAGPGHVISPADAIHWEGQPVAVQGVVRQLRTDRDGQHRFDLVADGAALPTRLDGGPLRDGEAITATGRLARLNGVLTLLADEVRGPVNDQAGQRVGLDALARDPSSWTDHAVEVQGLVERGQLRGAGVAIGLGDGAWPTTGPVTATVLLGYDSACACYRLDRVAAWSG